VRLSDRRCAILREGHDSLGTAASGNLLGLCCGFPQGTDTARHN